jgi:hypothetical protein
VHAVANREDQLATSVHVYSPPLDVMDYYGPDGNGNLVAVLRDPGGWDHRQGSEDFSVEYWT